MGIKKKKIAHVCRGHYYYYYYITVVAGYINPLSSPPPPPPRTTTGPERGRPIRIASATPRTPRQIRDETRGSVKMYFAPPAVDDDDDDYCACARKRGTRSAQRRPILSTAQLPAATTSAALASVSVTTVHTAAAGRARAYDSPDLKLTTPSPSGRANDARALINDLSLLRSLTSIHSSLLLLPAACVYLYIPPAHHRRVVYMYTPMTKLPCFVIFSKRYESLVIYYRRNYPLPYPLASHS